MVAVPIEAVPLFSRVTSSIDYVTRDVTRSPRIRNEVKISKIIRIAGRPTRACRTVVSGNSGRQLCCE